MSSFGWLDADAGQRRAMLDVVDVFREQGTTDDLGIGAVRDTFAEILFPGTSTLHTRLRYVLLIPWLMQHAARKTTPEEMGVELRRIEYRLIPSLLAGGEAQGVIGNRAKNALKSLPSTVYWGAMNRWQIIDLKSADVYFRQVHDQRALVRRATVADDPEARDLPPPTGIDAHLPPAPRTLLSEVDFTLTPA